ncbi:hypothetical protein RRG08_022068 [Elysia crispata]|uniref:Uncharacterized protein n=1 Tax=Elysia crispata TaxID=231223 RepID=A0AAE0Y338_9GAST|nr:hypothetical protein RRG08_022068 [Elysia crispata]
MRAYISTHKLALLRLQEVSMAATGNDIVGVKQSMEGQLYCEAHAPESHNTTPSPDTDDRNTDLFEMLEKLQGTRIDDQRCDINTFFKMLGIGLTSGDLPWVDSTTNWLNVGGFDSRSGIIQSRLRLQTSFWSHELTESISLPLQSTFVEIDYILSPSFPLPRQFK